MERNRQKKWDRRNLRTAATKLRVDEWMELRVVCAAEGVTPYALIRRLLREWLAQQR